MPGQEWKQKAAEARAKALKLVNEVPADGFLRYSLVLPRALLGKLGVQKGNPPLKDAANAFYMEASTTLNATEPAEYQAMLEGDPGSCTIIEYVNDRGQRCRKMVCYDEHGNENVIWDVCEV